MANHPEQASRGELRTPSSSAGQDRVSPFPPLEPGTLIDDRYEVVRHLGSGGMASVYEVLHLGLRSTHALKVLDRGLAADPELRNRFLAEGQIQAQLKHPNVVAVTEIASHPVAGLIMELVEGPDLAGYLQGLTRELTVTEVLDIFGPVLDAVGTAHAKGIVHRDLKPENILVARDALGRPVPKVVDFGIAKVLDDTAVQTGKRKTSAQTRMGTLLYMSPEQVRHSSEVDARSDVFALGAILYQLVTGRPAFAAPSDFDTMTRIVQGTFDPPERVVGGLHPVIAGCVRKALAVAPDERFQDCLEFRAALEEARYAHARPVPRPSRSYAVTEPPCRLPTAKLPQIGVPPARHDPTPACPPPDPPAPAPRALPANARHSRAIALVLALLCGLPGVGQMYNGQIEKGLLLLVGYWVGLFALLAAYQHQHDPPPLFLLWFLGVPAVGILDAYRIAEKRRRTWVRKWEWL